MPERAVDQGALLVDYARRAIAAHLQGDSAPEPPDGPAFSRKGGVFVTLHRGDELRGCIGRTDATATVAEGIAQCAVAAAVDDPRFEPVDLKELAEVEVEVSVLSPMSPLADPSALEVGRHGLVVEHRGRRGLLLPQVAVEHGWSPSEFLEQTCRKAGLPRDCWRDGAALLFVFEAEVFGGR